MNRIPKFENVVQWVTDMHKAGLVYHLDDDPGDVVRDLGGHVVPTFSQEERETLEILVASLTPEERELYFETAVALCHAEVPSAQASPVPELRENYLRPSKEVWEAMLEQQKLDAHKLAHFDALKTALEGLLAAGIKPGDFRLCLLACKGTALDDVDHEHADRFEAAWNAATAALTAANTKTDV
jgi:hypothetical protein